MVVYRRGRKDLSPPRKKKEEEEDVEMEDSEESQEEESEEEESQEKESEEEEEEEIDPSWKEIKIQFVNETSPRSLFIRAQPQKEKQEEEEEEEDEEGWGMAGEEEDEFPPERTLVVTNVPFDITEDQLQDIFEVTCGPIALVFFAPSPPPSSAFLRGGHVKVVFHERSSLVTAISSLPSLPPRKCLVAPPPRGLDLYKKLFEQNNKTEKQLQEESNLFMKRFDAQKRVERKREKAMLNVPDEDGFIKVSRSKRGGVTDGETGRVKAAKGGKGNAEELMKKRLLSDFYSFQKREVKKEKMNDLRIRFEADKERIARMKTNRRFMPY